jgi:hypothetical protein
MIVVPSENAMGLPVTATLVLAIAMAASVVLTRFTGTS